MKWRLYLVFSIPLILFGVLFSNMYVLQIKHGNVNFARAASLARIARSSPRGTIYFTDKNGGRITAAIDRKVPTIFAVPKEMKHPQETAAAVAKLLTLDAATLETSFSKSNDEYELLVDKASKEDVEKIKAAKLEGIHIGSANSRYYPLGNLGAHVLGFVGKAKSDEEIKGRYGTESYFDDTLRGGNDVTLTIDRDIEAHAEELLKGVVENFGAERGTVIVEEPKTGKILAMGNYPWFDPNDYSASPVGSFLNFAVQGIYEPGSVFKLITMGAGIDSGAVTPDTTFVDTGSLTLNQKTVHNANLTSYGKITMTEVIEHSVNTGAAFVARTMGYDNFYRYLQTFGIEEPTGITLPGELKGSMKSLKKNVRDINFATAAFGQGVAVTPLKLIAMVSAIANGGVMMQPSIIKSSAPAVAKKVIGEDAAAKVTQMMVSGVDVNHVAAISHYRVAGKSGTAQIPDFKHGGYSDSFIHTYAGFAPAGDPRFVILFKVDKPKADLAGATVVPAFRDLAQFLLDYYSVPPSKTNEPAP